MSLRPTRPSARPTRLRKQLSHHLPAALRRASLLPVLALSLLLTGAAPADASPEAEAGRSPESAASVAAEATAVSAANAAPAIALPAAVDAFFAGSAQGDLVAALRAAAPDLSPVVLNRAVAAAACAVAGGVEVSRPLLTVIDYSLPSTRPRLWVFDLARRDLLHRELVAHGMGSGDNYARVFSNTDGSKQTSLGLFRTADTYYGKNGYSMRLEGLEQGINHLALPRTIVVHGAPYVSEEFAARHGRLGRSWGCPALREEVAQQVIDEVKEGTLLFADHPQGSWLDGSVYLAGSCAGSPSVQTASHTR